MKFNRTELEGVSLGKFPWIIAYRLIDFPRLNTIQKGDIPIQQDLFAAQHQQTRLHPFQINRSYLIASRHQFHMSLHAPKDITHPRRANVFAALAAQSERWTILSCRFICSCFVRTLCIIPYSRAARMRNFKKVQTLGGLMLKRSSGAICRPERARRRPRRAEAADSRGTSTTRTTPPRDQGPSRPRSRSISAHRTE